MAITYYKRFRMEVDLDQHIPRTVLPTGYAFVAWREYLLDDHAEVKHRAFQSEVDSQVFPCLGDLQGCRRLMREIRRKPGFHPGATWLILAEDGYCGTVQGVVDWGPVGSIQNVGVVPAHRGLGLGRALVRQALDGFRRAGLSRAFLEVTAENVGAVRLYRQIGFRKSKTLYKAVDA